MQALVHLGWIGIAWFGAIAEEAGQKWSFVETFDSASCCPESFASPRWDVAVHSRDEDTFHQLESMDSAHGPSCEPPPATHPTSAYEDAVYGCKNHLMTSISAEGYGVIYLTPNHLMDLSQGTSVLRFDLSTLRTSRRDWVDVYVTAFDDNLQLPLSEDWPDLQGEPRNGIHIRMTDAGDGTSFRGRVFKDWVTTELPALWWVDYESWLVPSAKQRQTFELQLSRTHVRFGMPDFDQWWIDTPLEELGWDLGLVQLGHHSYNPTKDPGGCIPGHDASLAGVPCASPNTWHWDDVRISNTVPYVLTHADRRFASSYDIDPMVSLERPAPANAMLRFSAIGQVMIGFDGGAMHAPQLAAGNLQAEGNHQPGAFSSYWTPIPAGTTEVRFRFDPDGWWNGYEMLAKDVTVWSPQPYGVDPSHLKRRPAAGGASSKP